MTSITSEIAIGIDERLRTGSAEQTVEDTDDDDPRGIGSTQHSENENSTCGGTSNYRIEGSPYVTDEIGNDTANLEWSDEYDARADGVERE
jgi:hypothetical protein